MLSFTDLDENSCPTNIYNQSDSNNNNTTSHTQKKYLQLLNNSNSSGASMFGSAGSMRNCSYYNGSQPKSFSQQSDSGSSTSSLSDLDEITLVKEEPLSPHSSCPPSPNSNYNNTLPSISSINPDLMYDRKVNIDTWTFLTRAEIYCLHYLLQPSSLLRDQHLFTSQTCSTSRIKSEPQVSSELHNDWHCLDSSLLTFAFYRLWFTSNSTFIIARWRVERQLESGAQWTSNVTSSHIKQLEKVATQQCVTFNAWLHQLHPPTNSHAINQQPTEGLNRWSGSHRWREAHIACWRLSDSTETSVDESRRKVIEKDSPKD